METIAKEQIIIPTATQIVVVTTTITIDLPVVVFGIQLDFASSTTTW
jgi:hypothetical protein